MNTKIELLPLESAPKDGTFVVLFGPSGYMGTPLRAEVCKYDEEFRPLQPWVNHSGDSFTDGGDDPCGWLPLPQIPPITVVTNVGLDCYPIEFIQRMEKEIDKVMISNGFSRTTTAKGGKSLEFNYKQFGVVR